MKVCTICEQELPKESFYKTSSCCMPCKRKYNKEQYEKKKKMNKYKINW